WRRQPDPPHLPFADRARQGHPRSKRGRGRPAGRGEGRALEGIPVGNEPEKLWGPGRHQPQESLRTAYDRRGSGHPLVRGDRAVLRTLQAVAIIGSANCNDRSLLGTGDTEIAAVIVDGAAKSLDLGNGVQVITRKFARDLRMNLWKKFLGEEIQP